MDIRRAPVLWSESILVLKRIINLVKRQAQNARYRWNLVLGVRIDSPPVFIVGCGHSGTWLLLSILGAHSRMYAIPFESYAATKNDQKLFLRTLNTFDRMTIAAGKRRWIEKSPMHIEYITNILEWCPDARILIIIRDGRDVAFSLKARHGASIEKGIRRWMQANRAGEQYWTHPQVFVVRYEDLVTRFESTVRNMLQFLNENFEVRMKDFYKYTQDLFPLRGRKQPLTEEEMAIVQDIAGEMLRQYGYADDNSTFMSQFE